MKTDAPTPATVPTKRRQLHDALDRWLAEWLTRDDLTHSERQRVEAERERRKRVRGMSAEAVVGVLIGAEGATPEQLAYISGYLLTMDPVAVCHAGVARRVAQAFRTLDEIGAPDMGAVVRNADVVLAVPAHAREPAREESGVWAAIRYARHRKVPVRIVLPNGTEG